MSIVQFYWFSSIRQGLLSTRICHSMKKRIIFIILSCGFICLLLLSFSFRIASDPLRNYATGKQDKVIDSKNDVIATGYYLWNSETNKMEQDMRDCHPAEKEVLCYLEECEIRYVLTVPDATPYPVFPQAKLQIALLLEGAKSFINLFMSEEYCYLTVDTKNASVIYELTDIKDYDKIASILVSGNTTRE